MAFLCIYLTYEKLLCVYRTCQLKDGATFSDEQFQSFCGSVSPYCADNVHGIDSADEKCCLRTLTKCFCSHDYSLAVIDSVYFCVCMHTLWNGHHGNKHQICCCYFSAAVMVLEIQRLSHFQFHLLEIATETDS